jgi:uncharacterized OsmC-like protein
VAGSGGSGAGPEPGGDAPDPRPVSVRRTGTGAFRGTNSRGASVEIGDGEGQFRPGELLKLALAGCAAMSAEFTLSRRLGEDYGSEIVVAGATDRAENRYPRLAEEIRLDLTGLTEAEQERMRRLVRRVVAQACTVERSVTTGVQVDHDLVHDGRLGVARPPDAPSPEEQPS